MAQPTQRRSTRRSGVRRRTTAGLDRYLPSGHLDRQGSRHHPGGHYGKNAAASDFLYPCCATEFPRVISGRPLPRCLADFRGAPASNLGRRFVMARGPARRWRVIPEPERASLSFRLLASAPPGHECARERDAREVDRDCIVENAAYSSRGHGPAVGTAVFIEPRIDPVEMPAEAACRIATLIRTGNRVSASLIIRLELAAIRVRSGQTTPAR